MLTSEHLLLLVVLLYKYVELSATIIEKFLVANDRDQIPLKECIGSFN